MPSLAEMLLRRLATKQKVEAGHPFPVVDPVDLLKQFAMSGFDYKGQMSSGFGGEGRAIELSATFSVIGLDLPDILAPQADAGVGGEITKRDLVIVQRLPAFAAGEPCDPIGLLVFTGRFYAAGLKGGVSLAAGKQVGLGWQAALDAEHVEREALDPEAFQSGPLTLGIEASLGLQASAGGAFDLDRVTLQAPAPVYFKRLMDPRLVAKFYDAIGERRPTEILEGIRSITKSSRKEGSVREQFSGWLTRLSGGRARVTETDIDPVLADVEKEIKKIEDALEELALATDESTRQGLLKKEEDARAELMSFKHYRFELYRLRDGVAKREPPKKPGAAAGEPPIEKLCRLSISGFTVDAAAGVQATAELIAIPRSVGEAKGLTVGGQLKGTFYRFQTLGRSPQPDAPALVMTQETVIAYRQARIQMPGKEHCYNAMTYQSGVAYWSHPIRKSADASTPALMGSGLSFGASVDKEALEQLSEAAKDSENLKYASLFKRLATQLRVSPECLKECLAAWEHCELPGTAVLIESSLVLSTPLARNLKCSWRDGVLVLHEFAKGWRIRHDKWVIASGVRKDKEPNESAAEKPPPFLLEAIRIRFRIADMEHNSRTAFKLGHDLDSEVASRAVFELKRVDDAGSESIVDLYTHWFVNLGGGANAYELAVPPVALLHQ